MAKADSEPGGGEAQPAGETLQHEQWWKGHVRNWTGAHLHGAVKKEQSFAGTTG